MSAQGLEADPAERAQPTADGVRTRLVFLAGELRELWSTAMQRGDFVEATKLVQAGHAVHRAAIALQDDERFVGGAPPP